MRTKNDIFHSRNYLILNFLILCGYLILYPIITKKILPSDYGNYIFAHAIAMIIVGISSLGLKLGYKRNFFELYKSKQKTENLLFTVQIFAAFIFILVFIVNKIFEENILIYFEELKNINNFWSLLILALMFDSLSKYYLIFLENNLNSQKYFIITFSKTALYFILIIYFLFNNYVVVSLLYSLLASNSLVLIFTILSQIKNSSFRFKKDYIKSILEISIPNTPKVLFGQLNSKIDKILISVLSTFSNTGIYAIAQSISYVIFQIMTSLDKVFITKTNKMLFDNENDKIGPYLTSFFYFCSLPAFGLILFNDTLMDIFIDEKYHGSENIIIILSIYYFTLIFGKISSTQLIFAKKVWLNTNYFILNVILNIIFNIPLIYYFGITGAAIATLLSSLISMYLALISAKKFAPIIYEEKKIFITFVFLFIACFFAILSKNQIINIGYIAEQIINILIITVYFIYGYLLKIFDKDTIKKILRV